MEVNYLKRILIALGGNAILKHGQRGTVEEMRANIQQASRQLAPIIASWYQVVITHGNGPQVGNILLQNELAREAVPPMTLDVCGAATQGQLGYLLQQALSNELRLLDKDTEVSAIVTQTLIDPDDPGLKIPSKPIGRWYAPNEPVDTRDRTTPYLKDPEKGRRRLVFSPSPAGIINIRTIEALLRSGIVVIACGGGGVPVMPDERKNLVGVEAVVDKDLASQRLATALGAQIFLILTDVPSVYLDYGTPQEKPIEQIDAASLKEIANRKIFPDGSIGPKVEAAIRFVECGGEKAIIAHIDQAEDALKGKSGTKIFNAQGER